MTTVLVALLAAGIGIATTLFVLWPLLHPVTFETSRLDRARVVDLVRERHELLKALKEIEFDHVTGKLDEQDHGRLVREYRLRAVDVMRKLEAAMPQEDLVGEVRADLERASAGAAPGAPASGPDLDPSLSAGAAAATGQAPPRAEPSARFCPSCGNPSGTGAVFCGRCGTRLASAMAT